MFPCVLIPIHRQPKIGSNLANSNDKLLRTLQMFQKPEHLKVSQTFNKNLYGFEKSKHLKLHKCQNIYIVFKHRTSFQLTTYKNYVRSYIIMTKN